MSAPYDSMLTSAGVENPKIVIPPVDTELQRLSDEDHQKLLQYLVNRLAYGNVGRGSRLTRYARIDRQISTWMKLSKDDSIREQQEDVTGRSAALPINLPLLATHLEDMVSFFAEIYSPTGREFYATPPAEDSDSAKALANKMNRDTKARKYYKELCACLRALIKYNIGGLGVRWEDGDGVAELKQPGNRIEAIDMYNYLYDPTVSDVSKIPTDAEWTARVTTKNHMWLVRRALKGQLSRVDKFLTAATAEEVAAQNRLANRNTKQGTYYRFPPSNVGLSSDGQDGQTTEGGSINWESYGATLDSDSKPDIAGYEIISMYCWLNPNEFNLTVGEGVQTSEGLNEDGDGYVLYHFIIADSNQILSARPAMMSDAAMTEIPEYLSHLTQDDMKEAQRSMMEMMRGFQRFASFLVNVFIAGARKNIWGGKAVDPSMFDTDKIEQGDVAFLLKSKIQGRDVRTGLMSLDGNTGVQEAGQMLGQVMELVRTFYPSQALPAQIAGMDRAVKSQVSAVLQGSQRRLHMLCKLLDADLMNPTRTQCYRNIAANDAEGLENLDEEKVAKILGSGLEQLYAEKIAEMLKEILFAIIQNPESSQSFDLPALFTYWGRLQNTSFDLGDFVRQQPAAPTGPTPAAPPTGGAVAQ